MRFDTRRRWMALPLALLWPLAATAGEDSVQPAGAGGDVVAVAAADTQAVTPAVTSAAGPMGPTLDPAPSPPVTRDGWYSLSEGKHLGLQLDAGAPDGAGLSLLFRPWWWVRFNGGLAYNYVGMGVRGGVSFVPFHWAVTPSLSLDLGHYFSGDASGFGSNLTAAERDLLKHAVYDFASAQVGLEFGSQRSFSFYIRGGLVYLTSSASGSTLTAFATERVNNPAIQTTWGDAKLTAVMPCASLGFIFYVY